MVYMFNSPQNSPNEKTLAKPLLFGEFCGEITKKYYTDSPQNSPNKSCLSQSFLIGDFSGEVYIYLNSHWTMKIGPFLTKVGVNLKITTLSQGASW